MAKNYQAGVKDYRETYWMPDYTPKDTDFLACFKVIPQEGVPREEAAAAVAAELRAPVATLTRLTADTHPPNAVIDVAGAFGFLLPSMLVIAWLT